MFLSSSGIEWYKTVMFWPKKSEILKIEQVEFFEFRTQTLTIYTSFESARRAEQLSPYNVRVLSKILHFGTFFLLAILALFF